MKKSRLCGKYLIVSLPKDEGLKARLIDLGFTENSVVTIKRTAPSGDPAIVTVRGTDYAIRLTTLGKMEWKKI